MKIVVTGSSGHLGEALMRTLGDRQHEVVGIDILPRQFTTHVGSITDRAFVARQMAGVQRVFHTATLHKPHVATHCRQDFVDVDITGTLNLLEESIRAGVESFVFTSTTSVFGDALIPPAGAPAAWINEKITPLPRNIYGVTKSAAEDLCQLFHRNQNLNCIVLRTSRFFPEPDDNKEARDAYANENLKINEYLHRRVEIGDVVSAHLLAADQAAAIGFGKYIISATTPFVQADLSELRGNAPAVIERRVPEYRAEYLRRGWKMFPTIDRVYVNELAHKELGWQPRYDFKSMIDRLKANQPTRSPLARLIGSKGYHPDRLAGDSYPVE